jgi:hypothetical protein
MSMLEHLRKAARECAGQDDPEISEEEIVPHG